VSWIYRSALGTTDDSASKYVNHRAWVFASPWDGPVASRFSDSARRSSSIDNQTVMQSRAARPRGGAAPVVIEKSRGWSFQIEAVIRVR